MGVRRAVEMVLDAPNKHEGPIWTFGPLIHNPQVLDLLKDKGISVINDIPDQGMGTVLIRAHGVPPEKKETLEKAGVKVIPMTDADREQFARAVRPLYNDLVPADVAKAFLSAAEAHK